MNEPTDFQKNYQKKEAERASYMESVISTDFAPFVTNRVLVVTFTDLAVEGYGAEHERHYPLDRLQRDPDLCQKILLGIIAVQDETEGDVSCTGIEAS